MPTLPAGAMRSQIRIPKTKDVEELGTHLQALYERIQNGGVNQLGHRMEITDATPSGAPAANQPNVRMVDVAGVPTMYVFIVGTGWVSLTTTSTPGAHVLATTSGLGPEHTASGLTAGQALVATGATTARFQSLSHADLADLGADDHTIYALDTDLATHLTTDSDHAQYLLLDGTRSMAGTLSVDSGFSIQLDDVNTSQDITRAGSILMDLNGGRYDKAITWNDGGGNWNFHLGSYYNGGDLYTNSSAAGAAKMRFNGDTSAGYWQVEVAGAGVQDAAISWGNKLKVSTTQTEFGTGAEFKITNAGVVTAGTWNADVLTGTYIDESTVDHDLLLNYVANEHIDWTGASTAFSTSASASVGPLTATNITHSLNITGHRDGAALVYSQYTHASGSVGGFSMYRSKGTEASPTAMLSGQDAGYLRWYMYDGAGYIANARIFAEAHELQSVGNSGSRLTFSVAKVGTATLTDVIQLRYGSFGPTTSLTGTVQLGTSGAEWENVFSVLGTFSGNITVGALTATGITTFNTHPYTWPSSVGTNGQVLSWTTGAVLDWITPAAGVTDHGTLTGLSDDDHTIYVLADGTRAMTDLTVNGALNVNGASKPRVFMTCDVPDPNQVFIDGNTGVGVEFKGLNFSTGSFSRVNLGTGTTALQLSLTAFGALHSTPNLGELKSTFANGLNIVSSNGLSLQAAVDVTSTLTVTGFIQLATSGIRATTETGAYYISGGASSDSAQITLYGKSHGTFANDLKLANQNRTFFYMDESATALLLGGAGVSVSIAGPLSLGGALNLAAATTSISSQNMPHGVAPSSPTDGDIWTTTAGLYVHINGSTVGPLS